MVETTNEFHLLFRTDDKGNPTGLLLVTDDYEELERFRKRPDLAGVPQRGVTIKDAARLLDLLDLCESISSTLSSCRTPQTVTWTKESLAEQVLDEVQKIKGFDFQDPLPTQPLAS